MGKQDKFRDRGKIRVVRWRNGQAQEKRGDGVMGKGIALLSCHVHDKVQNVHLCKVETIIPAVVE